MQPIAFLESSEPVAAIGERRHGNSASIGNSRRSRASGFMVADVGHRDGANPDDLQRLLIAGVD